MVVSALNLGSDQNLTNLQNVTYDSSLDMVVPGVDGDVVYNIGDIAFSE